MPSYYQLSDRQRVLLELVAQELEPLEIAAQLDDEPAQITGELAAVVAALGARDLEHAVALAVLRCGLRPPATMSERIATIGAHGPLDPATRQLLGALAAGASHDDLFARTGADTVQAAVSLAVLAGLHHPRLTDDELAYLRHPLLGHVDEHCVRECRMGTTRDAVESVRRQIIRKLGFDDLQPMAALTAAIGAAIRSGQLKPPDQLAERVALVVEQGVPADMLRAIRALSCGVERSDVAVVCGLVENRVRVGLKLLSRQLDLVAYDTRLRIIATVAVVLWAGEPVQPQEPVYALTRQQVVVLRYLAVGYKNDRIAAALDLAPEEVRRLIIRAHAVFSSTGTFTTVARAVAAGVVVLPDSLQPALERLRAVELKPRARELLRLLAEGKTAREISKLDGWAGSRVQDTLNLERARVEVGTTSELIALGVAAGQVDVGPFELVASGNPLHPPIEDLLTSQPSAPDTGGDSGSEEDVVADDGAILDQIRELWTQIPHWAGGEVSDTEDRPSFPPEVEDFLDAHRALAIRAVRAGALPVPPGLDGYVKFLTANRPAADNPALDDALLQAVADGDDLEDARDEYPYVRGATASHIYRIQRSLRVGSATGAAMLALWTGWIT